MNCIKFLGNKRQLFLKMSKNVHTLYKSLDSVLEFLNRPENKSKDVVKNLMAIYYQVVVDENLKKINSEGPRHPLIVLEGFDGCGKTTTVKMLAEKINAEMFVTPPPCLHEIRAQFDDNKELRLAFYALGNYVAALQMSTILQTKPVVLDRYWHSTAAYELAQIIQNSGGTLTLPQKGDVIYKWPSDLLKPDKVLFLSVNETARLSRIKDRPTYTAQETLLKEEKVFRDNIWTAYRCMYEPSIQIINAMLSKRRVHDQIIEQIKPLFPANSLIQI